ncbi:FecR family protein [Telluribacter humicola]|uniref:hypothetical protein n=1 Tax=Telluribacter humicola TaxID=1720261 RepID=UPI001A95F4E7|nr:hypothetical protein [Telluribacter humicola]
MKNYSQYQLEDFLTDESFRNWILSGGEADAGWVWSQRLSHYPSLREDAQRAREIILATTLKEEPFAEGYFESISQGTLAAIRDQKQPRPLWTWRAAAAVVLLVGLGVWAVWNQKQVTTLAGEQLASTPVEPVRLEKDNTNNAIVPVALPDGSSILLYPGSSLTYSHVPGQNREVHLVGKAFFEVV